jgi:hypothetical protein
MDRPPFRFGVQATNAAAAYTETVQQSKIDAFAPVVASLQGR